ncbi:MAG: glycosyl transferase group 1 [Anaerocolumna sp.]|jgi:1,2-diacylglycerol-3-alpha-glucose alpha-1,2-glucosyltransferase|nr:glycosyl transferase group 1 [Anaerocolumna sp.]
MKIPVLIRDIPIYKDWLIDGENIYKGNDISQFQRKIKGILNQELLSLVENGYKVANERNIKEVGQQLINEYNKLMVQPEKDSIERELNPTGARRIGVQG